MSHMYKQTLCLGLIAIRGSEPFELTKRFIDLSPGAFPGYSLLTAFGEAAPLNLEYQKAGRVLPFPYHFLNNHLAMNIKPKNYDWVDFYDKVIDLTSIYFFSKGYLPSVYGYRYPTARWMNFMRAISNEGRGRLRFYRHVRHNLINDRAFRRYFEGESNEFLGSMKILFKKIWAPGANGFLQLHSHMMPMHIYIKK